MLDTNMVNEKITSYFEKNDMERMAYFKIVTNEERLRELLLEGKLYDFKNNSLVVCEKEQLEDLYLSSTQERLLMLAVNLFNYNNMKTDVAEIFAYLDADTAEIAFEAIRIRYNL